MLFFSALGIFIFCSQILSAQCKGDFSFQSTSAENGSHSGKIELSVNSVDAGAYTVNLYKMEGKIVPVETRQGASNGKFVFERLPASTYYIKVEWGDGCRKILGGLEGIIITKKDQER